MMRDIRNFAKNVLGVETGIISLLLIVFWLGWNTKSLWELARQVPQNEERSVNNTKRLEEIKEEQDGLRRDFKIYACSDKQLSSWAEKQLNCRDFR